LIATVYSTFCAISQTDDKQEARLSRRNRGRL